MAIKTISQFEAAAPTSNDKILFEQNGEGKSATIGDAVNTCSLTYEEIMASTDLLGKVSSASALKHLKPTTIEKTHWSYPSKSFVKQTDCEVTIPANSIYGIRVYRSYYHVKPVTVSVVFDANSEPDAYAYPVTFGINDGSLYSASASVTGFTEDKPVKVSVYAKDEVNSTSGENPTTIFAWYITF